MNKEEQAAYFKMERILRDKEGKPVGRVVLVDDFRPGEPLKVSILKVPRQYMDKVVGHEFYIGKYIYKVPEDIHYIKVTHNAVDHLLNSFVMEYVGKVE